MTGFPRFTISTLATIVAIGFSTVLVGCASDETPARRPRSASSIYEDMPAQSSGKSSRARFDGPPGMSIDSEMGVLETADVEDTLGSRVEDVRGCYQRAGKAQEYAGGRVLLRFHVAGDGHVSDVWVVESTLGNYSVERCLVDLGRHVVFAAPSGGRATTFEYPIEFRSTNELAVLDIDGVKVEHDLAVFMPQLAACGPVAKQTVAAIIYIEPNGFPGSVGLAVANALDETAADCVVQTIRRWKMSAVLPGHALRTTFNIPTVVAQAEPSPSRHAVSGASPRRRRR